MKTDNQIYFIVERSKKLAALYGLVTIGAAITYLCNDGINGGNGVLLILLIGGIGQTLRELNGKRYAFAIFDHGIDDQSFGGVGVVGWEEMESCHVKSLFGQEMLAFRPRSQRAFWASRGLISHMHLILYRCFFRNSIGVSWIGWAKSPHDGCAFLNKQIQRSQKRNFEPLF